MNIKSIQMLAAMAMMVSDQSFLDPNKGRKFVPDTTPPKKVIPKGCQEFDFQGEKIVALNYKSALKKYNKMLKRLTERP